MTPRPKARRGAAAGAGSPFPEYGLAELGLTPGDAVRFRRRDSERWANATVARREKDGSIGLHDGKGAARAIAIDLIEVRTVGPRGGVVWEPLTERAARTEQLHLVATPPTPRVAPQGPPAPVPVSSPAPARAGDTGAEPEDGQLTLL